MNIPMIILQIGLEANKPGLWASFVNLLRGLIDGINTITSKIPEPFGGYGLAIILFTILFRTALLPLDLKSKKSTKKMSELQPEIEKINQKYKNDAEKRNQKTLELYQKHKVNPLGGCLPMLLTLPLMFAMFAALRAISDAAIADQIQESFLWMKNVWSPDSPVKNIVNESIPFFGPNYNGLFILPILAGVTSYLHMKMSQPKGGNQQMKGFTAIMPFMSVWFCSMYTASFALYWVTSNIYQMVQQYITDRLQAPPKEGDEQ
ncbi:MAG: YidC/Oxa1 family membrane protein insertase [Clostridiales bacterium]|jgi:YidC/Oxa1 family membrane protein insertase|nr:YidC/Oxa1 family membrane protein insertase [Bacillota bacterium]NLH59683.1 YidC/Oxa1 family membrane protein insertase [Clostridiales bacterium]